MNQASEEKPRSLTGGILAGTTWLTSRSYTWPLVRCTIAVDGITLTTWCPQRFHFHIPKEFIRRLEFKDYRVAGFLRIIHDLRELPPYIRFGTFVAGELKEALKQFHYI
jgi:hypothetical protein